MLHDERLLCAALSDVCHKAKTPGDLVRIGHHDGIFHLAELAEVLLELLRRQVPLQHKTSLQNVSRTISTWMVLASSS
jgi:hypothetical protein